MDDHRSTSPQSISARIAALKIDQLPRKPGNATPPSHPEQKSTPPPLPPRPLPVEPSRRNPAKEDSANANASATKSTRHLKHFEAESRDPTPHASANTKNSSQPVNGAGRLPPQLPPRRVVADASASVQPTRSSETGLPVKESTGTGSSRSSPSARSPVYAESKSTASSGTSASTWTDTSLSGSEPAVKATRKLPPPVVRSPEEPLRPGRASPPRPRRCHTGEASLHDSSLRGGQPAPLPTGLGTARGSIAVTVEPRLPKPRRSALSFALNETRPSPPSDGLPQRPKTTSRAATVAQAAGLAPPIPLATKPAYVPSERPSASAVGSERQCLVCRDFSGPDGHAAKFPRQTLPLESTQWLAHQLTAPFSSSTDKARAIFTWLHHNIAYDVESFFNGDVKHSTPASTLSSGLAVCSGYAGLFSALASHAGLESVVISGHGKGYGFAAMARDSSVPPFSAGHAWNAARIDGGEWKLIDCCWGAGVVNGKGKPYTKRFDPTYFTMSNGQFGRRHFPENAAYFFRGGGSRPPTWEEYLRADGPEDEAPTVFSGCDEDHGLDELSLQPSRKKIVISSAASPDGSSPARIVRFQFSKKCPHWDFERMGKGKPYVFFLSCSSSAPSSFSGGGRDDDNSRPTEHGPFSTDGATWWLDVPSSGLGGPGARVKLYAVTQIDGVSARGRTPAEYTAAKGKKSMRFGGVAAWEVI